MEPDKRIPLLYLLPVLFCHCINQTQHCPTTPDKSLDCTNDLQEITCVWNNTCPSNSTGIDAGTVCTLKAEYNLLMSDKKWTIKPDCQLKPTNNFTPSIRNCTLAFERTLQSNKNVAIYITCEHWIHILVAYNYKLASHIKLKPPALPVINSTTLCWSIKPHDTIKEYNFQLQWKKEAQTWKEAYKQTKNKTDRCDTDCSAELDPKLLEKGETYQARVRLKPTEKRFISNWSDWSPTVVWVSTTGTTKPPPPWDSMMYSIVGAAVALILGIILLKAHIIHWVRKMRGFYLPDPKMFFQHEGNLQAWLNPRFNVESFQSFMKSVEISPVEVTDTVDAVAAQDTEAELSQKKRWASNSQPIRYSFSNPTSYLYFPFTPPYTGGNTDMLSASSPNCPLISRVRDGKDSRDDRVTEIEVPSLFLNHDSACGTSIQVCPDYESCGFQHIDSVIDSTEGKQVSRQSMEEVDRINKADELGEGAYKEMDTEGERWEETENGELFSRCGVISRGSIQISLDYERVDSHHHTQRHGFQSPDSGVGSIEEEQSQESVEEAGLPADVKAFQLPPFLGDHTGSPFLPIPFKFTDLETRPSLKPIPCYALETSALMSSTMPILPSSGGYMPVSGEQS